MIHRKRTKERFKIIGELGRGAFSTVYKVCRLEDGEIYALKMVELGELKQKELENSLNEIRILASIEHPNIIAFREAYLEEESYHLCIVMDYAGGGDLARKVRECREQKVRFPENLIIRFFYQLASALLELHSRSIIHRDLKAANVFLSTDLRSVRLGDMNVSKIVKSSFASTQTGTPYYASPEVWRDEPYGLKADIWSLGCVVYEMCMLRPPFNATDMDGLFHRVQSCRPDGFDGFYSKPLRECIARLMVYDAADRPSCEKILAFPIFSDLRLLLGDGASLNAETPLEVPQPLLETIKDFRDFKELARALPRSRYSTQPIEEPPNADTVFGRKARLQAFFKKNAPPTSRAPTRAQPARTTPKTLPIVQSTRKTATPVASRPAQRTQPSLDALPARNLRAPRPFTAARARPINCSQVTLSNALGKAPRADSAARYGPRHHTEHTPIDCGSSQLSQLQVKAERQTPKTAASRARFEQLAQCIKRGGNPSRARRVV